MKIILKLSNNFKRNYHENELIKDHINLFFYKYSNFWFSDREFQGRRIIE
jgi:hypothetical protein